MSKALRLLLAIAALGAFLVLLRTCAPIAEEEAELESTGAERGPASFGDAEEAVGQLAGD